MGACHPHYLAIGKDGHVHPNNPLMKSMKPNPLVLLDGLTVLLSESLISIYHLQMDIIL